MWDRRSTHAIILNSGRQERAGGIPHAGATQGVGLLRLRHRPRLGLVAHFSVGGGPDELGGGHRCALGGSRTSSGAATVQGTLSAARVTGTVGVVYGEPIPMESGSALVDQRIRELGDWRGNTLAKVREIIHEADREIVEGTLPVCLTLASTGMSGALSTYTKATRRS